MTTSDDREYRPARRFLDRAGGRACHAAIAASAVAERPWALKRRFVDAESGDGRFSEGEWRQGVAWSNQPNLPIVDIYCQIRESLPYSLQEVANAKLRFE